MSDYIVDAKSRENLREFANTLRKHLGLENVLWVPVVELLDVLSELFESFSYEIVSDNELPECRHAEVDTNGHMKIKETAYERACKGEGRDRMTIAHEYGHYFTICFSGVKLQRNFGNKKVEAYQDPEWQAKCFAGEFMIPYELTKDMTPAEIVDECGVSFDAAKYQYDHR